LQTSAADKAVQLSKDRELNCCSSRKDGKIVVLKISAHFFLQAISYVLISLLIRILKVVRKKKKLTPFPLRTNSIFFGPCDQSA